MKENTTIILPGQLGFCGNQEVFLGFAPANLLHSCSFADTLNEDTGEGYQRPFSREHSRSFKQYIEQPETSTIPLTFNLRPGLSHLWSLERHKAPKSSFLLLQPKKPCLAQVDCQHRLGDMAISNISFAFMSFIGLDLRTEMSLFNIINSKAKGLSSSLTDYHQTKLVFDLAEEAPHLLLAKRLNEDAYSPWYKLVRYGGETTSGLMRRTSFRMLQTSIRKLIKQMRSYGIYEIEIQYSAIVNFWNAVKDVFPEEWADHRHHLLAKGIGLYSLMELLGYLLSLNNSKMDREYFKNKLNLLKSSIDWKSDGMFSDAGGKKGAHEVFNTIKKAFINENSIS